MSNEVFFYLSFLEFAELFEALNFCHLSNLGNIFSAPFSLSSPSKFPVTHLLDLLVFLHKCCSTFLNIFSSLLLSLNNVYWPIFTRSFFAVIIYLLLNVSSEFFTLDIFSLQISTWFFLESFFCWDLLSFYSLWSYTLIVLIAPLKCLLIPNSMSVSTDYLFSWVNMFSSAFIYFTLG